MSSRRSTTSSFVVALATVGLFAGGGSLAISACSSSTADSTTSDGGTEGGTDARQQVEAGPEEDSSTLTPAQCEAKCKADHPGAAAKEDLIDECWSKNCEGPCLDETGFDAGADASDVDAGGMLCGTDVSSGVDDSCDKCTEAFCCTSWKGCFGDPDCTAYDSCVGDCQQ